MRREEDRLREEQEDQEPDLLVIETGEEGGGQAQQEQEDQEPDLLIIETGEEGGGQAQAGAGGPGARPARH